MFLQITFPLIALFSLNAAGLENSIPGQVYTAEQHLKDIKMLLESLKYEDHEIGLFSSEKRSTNQALNVINKVLEERLKKSGNRCSLRLSIPTLAILIHREILIIPGSEASSFYPTFIELIKKRNEELKRLKTEDPNMVNVEKNIEDHKND
jgi:hypothetical protein